MSFSKIVTWVKKRLTERSTYVGLAAIATAVGAESLGVKIGQIGEVLTVAFGTFMVMSPADKVST